MTEQFSVSLPLGKEGSGRFSQKQHWGNNAFISTFTGLHTVNSFLGETVNMEVYCSILRDLRDKYSEKTF